MEKKTKLYAILEGIGLIALGVLIAAFGVSSVLNTYFGIVLVVGGAFVIGLCVYDLVRSKLMLFPPLFLGVAALLIGIFVLIGRYSFDFLLYTLVLLIIAGGIALIFYGIYTISKGASVYGISQLIVGSVVTTLGFLYLFLNGFYKVFWIVAGILIALYGVFFLFQVLTTKTKKTRK